MTRFVCSAGTVALSSATVMLAGRKETHSVTEAPTPVRMQRIEFVRATETRTYCGVVRARREIDLGFRVTGKIVERLVNIADRVNRIRCWSGLDSTDYRLSVEPIEGVLAESGLAQTAADEKRYEKLLAERWVSPASYEQKQAAFDETRGRVERPSGPWALRASQSSGLPVPLLD